MPIYRPFGYGNFDGINYVIPAFFLVTKFNNGVGNSKSTRPRDHAIYHTKTYRKAPSVVSLL